MRTLFFCIDCDQFVVEFRKDNPSMTALSANRQMIRAVTKQFDIGLGPGNNCKLLEVQKTDTDSYKVGDICFACASKKWDSRMAKHGLSRNM